VNKAVLFDAQQTDNITTISSWHWIFDAGSTAATQQASHIFQSAGSYDVKTFAIASNGCSSDTAINTIRINAIVLHATNDTIIIKDQPLQLNVGAAYTGTSTLNYNWSPATGLNDPAIAMPIAILQDDQRYIVTVQTAEGCVAVDTVNVTIFKGSAIYVPSGFTPNNDGLNDVLRPRYIGIRTLGYFIVYNRWGQQIFTTASMTAGWDGTLKGALQEGTFVWIVAATDYAGKKYQLKGTVTIVR
jgi:gliding motility-associated-like protein